MEKNKEKMKNCKIVSFLEKELSFMEPNMKEWSLKYFRNHKNRYIKDLEIIDQFYKGGKLIEIGSAPYHLIYCLKKKGLDVVGVDLNPDRGSKFIKRNKIKIVKNNIEKEKLPFSKDTFDFVVLNEVFEHLRINPIFALKEIHRVAKKGSILLLTTPNLYSLAKRVFFNIGRGFNDPYDEFEKIYTLGHAGHIREYSNREVRKFLEKTGFSVIKVDFITHKKMEERATFKGIIKDIVYMLFPKTRATQIVLARVEK